MAKYAVYGPDGSAASAALPANKAHGALKQTSAGDGNWEYVVPGRNAADSGDLNPANIATALALGTAGTFARADHTHDLPESTFRAVAAELTTDLAVNGQKITNVGTPTAAGDAATKAYVDAAMTGADLKNPVAVATTANITRSGEQTIDGVLTSASRILVKNQATPAENGIYVTAAGAWARATDADSDAEVTQGVLVPVAGGDTQDNTIWFLTTADPITVGVTGLTFEQFSGPSDVLAGEGLVKSGNTIAVGTTTGLTKGADTLAVDYAAPSTTQDAAGTSAGVANSAMRTDAKLAYDMGLAGDVANVSKAAAAAGTSNKFARADHKHDTSTGAPSTNLSGSSTNAEGSSPNLARADHSHAIDNATESVAGFMSAADKTKLNNLPEAQDGTVQTTNATPATAATFSPAVSTAYTVEAIVTGKKSDDTQMAGYKLLAMFRRNGAGTLSQVGTTLVVGQNEDDANWDATLKVSGANIIVEVTGIAATTIDWAASLFARKHA